MRLRMWIHTIKIKCILKEESKEQFHKAKIKSGFRYSMLVDVTTYWQCVCLENVYLGRMPAIFDCSSKFLEGLKKASELRSRTLINHQREHMCVCISHIYTYVCMHKCRYYTYVCILLQRRLNIIHDLWIFHFYGRYTTFRVEFYQQDL